jgi:hypothetical protein
MCKLLFLTLATFFFWSFPNQAAQETAGPEHERLRSMVGEWDYQGEQASCTLVFEQFGDFFVRGDFECTPTSRDPYTELSIYSYDAEEGVLKWHRYFSYGGFVSLEGSVKDNMVTWVSEEVGGVRSRLTSTEESPDLIVNKWERSVDGGPWEVTGEYIARRVR